MKYAAVWNGYGMVGYETEKAAVRGLPIRATFDTVAELESYIMANKVTQ